MAARETSKMSIVDRIRRLFSGEGDEAQKIQAFAEQRAKMSERRDRLYAGIGQLERREQELLEEGRNKPSNIVRRRLAAQIAQLRKDIQRQNTTANMLNQQVNIISTRIHNLTLIQQGQMVEMPSTEELTEEAVQAEELLEQIRGDADLVSTLETGMSEAMTSQEELDILQEFDQPVAAPKEKAAPEATPRSAEAAPPEAEWSPPAAAPETPEPAAPDADAPEPDRREPEAN